MSKKRRTYASVIDLQSLLEVKKQSSSSRKKKSNVEPKEVKQEKVAPKMFSVNVPVHAGM